MKIYTISVVIEEGSDEFWESLPLNSSGCDDVLVAVRQILFESGFQEGHGTTVRLVKFEETENE